MEFVVSDVLTHIGPSLELDGGDNTVVRTVSAGVYAASFTVRLIVAGGNRGNVMSTIHIDVDGANAAADQSAWMVADDQSIETNSFLTWYSPANGKISGAFVNDGGAHQNIAALILAVQRIS